jgi:predicted phosphodiesterase
MSEARLGHVVGIFADVHGSYRTLERALAECAAAGVTTVALLGDLFDREEQADAAVAPLVGWDVIGVYGNHERDVALAAANGEIELRPETTAVLSRLEERVEVGDICFTHEQEQWGVDPLAQFRRAQTANGAQPRITFVGHTHFRAARDERGPIDLGRGRLVLNAARRYLINPGALADGRFAIWDRTTAIVHFRQIVE